MAGAAALDQLEIRVDLIGPIDGQIDTGDGIEALERNTQFGRQHFPLEGGGDASDVLELTALELGAQALDHQGRRRAGAQAHDHAVADLLHRRLRHGLLHAVLQISHHRGRKGP